MPLPVAMHLPLLPPAPRACRESINKPTWPTQQPHQPSLASLNTRCKSMQGRKEAENSSSAPVIDVTKHGIFKVLGKGALPEQPFVVRAKFVSKLVEKKIKAVGGAVQLVA